MIRLRPAGRVVAYVLLLVWALVNLLPIAIMIVSSFKGMKEIFSRPFALPESWSLRNYVSAWKMANFALYFRNSILVAVLSILLTLLVSSMAAYVFARFVFPGSRALYLYILSGLALPARLAILPMFLLIRGIGLSNTLTSLIVLNTATTLSFSIFLLTGFFKAIPKELDDSARIDGAGNFRIYRRISLPLLKPAMATVAIFNFINIWNDFFFPLIFINARNLRTIPLGIQIFFGEYSIKWDLLFAALNISIIPVIVLFLILSRQFIAGITEGAIK